MELHSDRWLTELITISIHSGTHIDAPNHKLAQWKGINNFPLEQFAGKAVVADFRDSEPRQRLTPANLQARLPMLLKDRIVLIATGWGYKTHDSQAWYKDIPYLSPDAASWLLEKKVRAVGIDHWSIGGPMDPDKSLTHSILMADNRWIVENMRFPAEVFEFSKPFELWCLPVNMPRITGALCRPVVNVTGR